MSRSPSSAPVPKVAAAGIAGAFVGIILWAINYFYQIEVPAEVASALTTIVAFVAGYMTPPAGAG